jgi:hypothetical protein
MLIAMVICFVGMVRHSAAGEGCAGVNKMSEWLCAQHVRCLNTV